jgi:Flp pilus assembly pilin Flp
MLKQIVSNAMQPVRREEEGQSLVEYALIISLVAVVLIAGLQALQGGITGVFNNILASL